MRICAFGRALPLHAVGGLELHFQAVTRGLAERGHDVTVITTKNPGASDYIEEAGVRIHLLAGTLPGRYEFGYWDRSRRMFERLGGNTGFDVVLSESSGAYGYLGDKIRNAYSLPVVFIAHGTALRDLRTKWRLGFPTPKRIVGSLMNIAGHFRDVRLFRYVDIVVCISESVRESVVRELGVGEERLRVVQNGVDTEMFRPDNAMREETRMDLGIGREAKILLCAGRLRREKGVHVAIEALAGIARNIAEPVLIIIGTGKDETYLKELASARDRGSRIVFKGMVPHERLPYYYNACDLFLMPSLAEEGLPLTLLEAMACGKPVVSSASGGIGDALIDGVNGLLSNRGDVASLTERAAAILADDALARSLGDGARATVLERFDEGRMLDGIEAALTEAVGGSV
jgi:phosphatidylinositol alpha-1,6-mannosyltransferase